MPKELNFIQPGQAMDIAYYDGEYVHLRVCQLEDWGEWGDDVGEYRCKIDELNKIMSNSVAP